MPTTLLFVYGSLKRGERNHALLRDQVFLREAVTSPIYRLVDLGPYPGLLRDESDGVAVRGELWAVSECTLDELDDFEGDEYRRGTIDIEGESEPVGAYFCVRVPIGVARSGDRWPFPLRSET